MFIIDVIVIVEVIDKMWKFGYIVHKPEKKFAF